MPNWNWLPLFVVLGCQTSTPSPSQAPSPARGVASEAATLGWAPARRQPGISSDCINYSTTSQGPFSYQNNMWAEAKAKGPFEQCVIARKLQGKTQLGWTWNWPGYEPLGFGYPEIIFGWKPWSSQSTTALLPLRISNIRSLTVSYAVDTKQTGKLALSLSMFVTNDSRTSAPNPLSIVDELVVWLDYPTGDTPVGKRIATTEIAGVGYELWHSPQHGDRGDGTGWDLYYLKGPNHQLEGALEVQPLLEHLAARNLISSKNFVASVELGNELMSGSGTTWVLDFDVGVNPPG